MEMSIPKCLEVDDLRTVPRCASHRRQRASCRGAQGARLWVVDPMVQRKAQKTVQNDSFKSVAALWLDHWRLDKSERHVRTTEQRLTDYAYGPLGHRAMGSIAAADVVKVIKAVEARGIGETARRVFEVISQIFRYAVAHGLAERNPAADVPARSCHNPSAWWGTPFFGTDVMGCKFPEGRVDSIDLLRRSELPKCDAQSSSAGCDSPSPRTSWRNRENPAPLRVHPLVAADKPRHI